MLHVGCVPADTAVVHPSQEARLLAALDHERAWREMLQEKLTVAEASQRQAREQVVEARLESQRERQIAARTGKICTALQERLLELEATLRQIEQQRAADAAAAADRLTQRHAEFTAGLAEAARSRDTLAQQLREARAALDEARASAARQIEGLRAALQEAQARHAAERAADAERLAARDAEAAAGLAQICTERDAVAAQLSATSARLEQTVEHAARAKREADVRHELELATAASRRDALQKQVDQAVAQAAAERQAFERQLGDAAAAIAKATEERARADAEAAARIAEISADRDALQLQLTDAAAALEESRSQRTREEALARATLEETLERHQGEIAAATSERKALQRQHEDAVARAAATRDALERQLSDAAAASSHRDAEHARARRRLLVAAAALRRRTADHKARLDAQLAGERADHERRLERHADEARHAGLERAALQESLAATQAELQELRDIYDDARHDFERAQAHAEEDRRRLAAEYDQARQSLDNLRDAFNSLEQVSSEHALERSRLEGVVADRDARISEQASSHAAAEQAWRETLRHAEDTLSRTLEARNRDVAALQGQLDASQMETRRQFEHAPYAVCRVARDGTLRASNRALARLLGYAAAGDLAGLDLASVFEAPADLRWLIDRAATDAAIQPIETAWKKQDHTRLTVRLHVERAADGGIEVAVEDMTELRATEDDLRHARRMEAVGRLASEVAATCDTLLRGVSQSGQHWLAAMESDLGFRRQGERLFGDVSHATSLLQRLAAYGNEQRDALEDVDLRRVLRNLEPVLKRVVGDGIEVALPKDIPTLLVDVERPCVERVLVNVASYARERMPYGGRLKIDLTSSVVDRTFLDKYPNVRPGPHVIATVTEERGAKRVDPPALSHAGAVGDATTAAGEKPGVDLSALVQLLADHGGHLWVTAEPPGNMTLKIHLPLRASENAPAPPPLTTSNSGRSFGRWFRH